MTNSDDATEALKNDPTLRRVGEEIDDAKDDARKIFGEPHEERTTGEPTREDDPDEDLGGAAPVP